MLHAASTRRRCLSVIASLALIASTGAAHAQAEWPTRAPIRIIVPSAAGAAADFVARIFGRHLEQRLGQTVVVENQPGAATLIGVGAVMRAPADGYTFLLSGSSTQAANPSMFVKLPYDPARDFVEIGLFGMIPMIAVVKPGSPLKSIADVIARGKARDGHLSYGYYSSSSQVPPALIESRTGMRALAAPYKNITQITTDLAGGVIDFAFLDAMSAASALNGLLTPIAVTSPQRSPNLPAVPAVAETLPGFDMQTWLGLSARAGTPPEVIKRMGEYLRSATAEPAIRDALMKQGMTPRTSTPQEHTFFVAAERTRWAEFVRIADIKPQ
ncbi:Bug family tripartite tricarboxylate transporter substrate binding protein [Variovorax rhizosphaerae]|uniref:Tripartite tricarboxylate transporter substrate-binding protein n=1 Tax=Variovorax rhizosphaerae TaxID=1836200 RepID=A0ABU8WTP6_9BURK